MCRVSKCTCVRTYDSIGSSVLYGSGVAGDLYLSLLISYSLTYVIQWGCVLGLNTYRV